MLPSMMEVVEETGWLVRKMVLWSVAGMPCKDGRGMVVWSVVEMCQTHDLAGGQEQEEG